MRLFHHFFLLRELVKRDFEARYSGSLLGFFWSFAQPLWQLLLFTFVFSGVMRLKLSRLGEMTESFPIFLFCGLLPWMALNEGVTRSTTAIIDTASLVKKLRFPAELLLLAVVLTALAHEGIALALFLVVLALTGHAAWGGLLLLLLAIPLQIALTLGLALLLSTVHVFFRDTVQVLNMVFMGWFYLTPIVYPLSFVPEASERCI